MKLSTTVLSACAVLVLAGCAEVKNKFVGEWRTSVQCLDHESEPGHADQDATPVHLEGTYTIGKRGQRFVLEPRSGDFKDEFGNCELKFDPGQGNIPDGSDFSCDSFDPGPGAINLSGTCDLTHSGRPTPHDVQVFIIDNSPLYDGGRNPVLRFSHPGPAHGGWLH